MPRGSKRQGPGGRAAGSKRDKRDKREGAASQRSGTSYSESKKAEQRTSEVGKSRDTGWGSYKGSGMGLGGGQSMHEAYSKEVGSSYSGRDRDGQSDRYRSSWSSQKASKYDYGFDKYQSPTGANLTGEGLFADAWKSTQEFLGGEEDWTRSEGWSGYGYQNQKYRDTVPDADRSMSERVANLTRRFQEAPLDTVADIMDNPMINMGLAATGLGAIGFGVQAVDKIADMIQGETTVEQGMRDLAATTVEMTPLGAQLGIARPIVSTGLRDLGQVPEKVGGLVGGTVGSQVAGRLGTAVAGPIGGAIAAAAGGAAGSFYAREQVRQAPTGAPSTPKSPPRDRGDSRVSPLISSGEQAVARSEQLRTQDPDVLRYAQQVPVPMYGVPQQQLPMYS